MSIIKSKVVAMSTQCPFCKQFVPIDQGQHKVDIPHNCTGIKGSSSSVNREVAFTCEAEINHSGLRALYEFLTNQKDS